MPTHILLDHVAVPERGRFTLAINRSVEIVVTAEEAQRKAKEWLIDEISYMMITASPTLVVGECIAWRVPAILTASHIGSVGMAGEVDVDVETGEIYTSEEHKAAILAGITRLVQRIPPYMPHKEMPEGVAVTKSTPTRKPGRPEGTPLDFLPSR